MKIKCVKGFRDKTTAKKIEEQTKIVIGQILECDDELAKERIEKGLCEEYIEPIEEVQNMTNQVVETVDETVSTKKKNKKK